MPIINNIKGGSAAGNNRKYRSNFFQSDVDSLELRTAKNTYRGRFLPAFDTTRYQPSDPEFKTSFVSYRDANLDQDSDTKTEGFTDWFFVLQGYTWLGNSGKSFLSGINARGNSSGVDPMFDAFLYCKKNKDRFNALIDNKSPNLKKGEKPPVQIPRSFMMANALIEEEGQMVNKLIYTTNMTLADLKGQLAWRATRNSRVVTPAWQDYLFGDITDPATGIMFTARHGTPQNNTQGIQACVFEFSRRPQTLDGEQPYPLDLNSAAGRAALEKRYLIASTDVLNIAEYDDMLEYLVADGTIPYEVLEAACAPHTNRMPVRKNTVVSSPTPPPEDDDVPMGSAPVMAALAKAAAKQPAASLATPASPYAMTGTPAALPPPPTVLVAPAAPAAAPAADAPRVTSALPANSDLTPELVDRVRKLIARLSTGDGAGLTPEEFMLVANHGTAVNKLG